MVTHTLAMNLVFYISSSLFAMVGGYLNIQSEVSSFNNRNIDSMTTSKIKKFVDRLLPRHV